MNRTDQRRRGLTLFEVVVAMAIFMISVIGIYQLITFGRDRALDVRMQTRTSLRCQAKLSEVIVGAVPLESTGGYSSFDDDKDLQWSLSVESVGFDGAMQVKVSVKSDLPDGRTVESQLAQIILDPSIRGSTLDPPPQANLSGNATKDAAEPSTSGTTGSGTTGSGTTAPTGGTKTGTGAGTTAPTGGTKTGTGTGTPATPTAPTAPKGN